MNWIEWKGEAVGDIHHTVCLCVYSYVEDDEPPVVAIIPRAYCLGSGERPVGNEWEFYAGDTSQYHRLSSVPRKTRMNGVLMDDHVNIYKPKRGDKIFYCVPTLPDGNAFNLNDIKGYQYKGLAVVRTTRTNLVQVNDLQMDQQ